MTTSLGDYYYHVSLHANLVWTSKSQFLHSLTFRVSLENRSLQIPQKLSYSDISLQFCFCDTLEILLWLILPDENITRKVNPLLVQIHSRSQGYPDTLLYIYNTLCHDWSMFTHKEVLSLDVKYTREEVVVQIPHPVVRDVSSFPHDPALRLFISLVRKVEYIGTT